MAIDFKLHASNGHEVQLSDYRGKNVVLYFYPKDMTPGCTTESCDFRDYNGQFEQLNTVVLGISPDDIKSHTKFISKYELPFLLLADTEQVVSNQFGVWGLKKMYGKEYYGIERSTFLINGDGEIVKEWRKVKVPGHVQEVLEAVKSL
jgi:peroxiredoxin Q/BCP